MSAIWFRLRAEVRSRWRAYAGLALLIGFLGGAVLTVLEGAHRTATSFHRFELRYTSPDMIIPNAPDPTGRIASFSPAEVRRLPQIKELEVTKPVPMIVNGQSAFGVAEQDPELGIRVFPLKIVSGRNLDPRNADEAILAYQSALRLHLHLGERFPLVPIPPVQALLRQMHAPVPPTLRIVGIYVVPTEFPPSTASTDFHFSPALFRALPPNPTPSIVLGFKDGARDVAAVTAELTKLARPKAVVTIEPGAGAANGRRSVQVQAAALWVLAVAVAVLAILILAQTVSRHLSLEAGDYPILLTLGATRRQLWLLGVCRVAMIAAAGTAVALIVAYLLSPIWPIGTARIAEPRPGLSFDPLILIAGAAGTVCASVVLAALPAQRVAWQAGAPDPGVRSPALIPATALRFRFPLLGLVGIRIALRRGRGSTAVPVLSTIGAMGVSIAALVAALVFGASLSKLLDTPRLYGVTWDAALQSSHDLRSQSPVIGADPAVSGVAFGVPSVRLEIEGQQIDTAVFDPPVRGKVAAPMLDGRRPVGLHDIALGSRLMTRLHAHVGQPLTVLLPGGVTTRMRVVGKAVIPPSIGVVIVEQTTNSQGFGEGALITYDALSSLSRATVAPAMAFVKFRPGVDIPAASKHLSAILGNGTSEASFETPGDLFNFGRIRNLPLLFAGIVILFGVATLTHMLISTVRRRRRDIAVLKVLGLRRRGVLQLVAWQASTLVALSLAIAIPVGIAAGRIGWKFFAAQQGVVGDPRVPVLALALALCLTVLVANVIAALPGRQATMLSPAVVLQAE
jgi:ABC-type lipoprotein release transport system permease subunit